MPVGPCLDAIKLGEKLEFEDIIKLKEKDSNYYKPDMSLFHLHLKFRELCGTSAHFLPGCLINLSLSAHVF